MFSTKVSERKVPGSEPVFLSQLWARRETGTDDDLLSYTREYTTTGIIPITPHRYTTAVGQTLCASLSSLSPSFPSFPP